MKDSIHIPRKGLTKTIGFPLVRPYKIAFLRGVGLGGPWLTSHKHINESTNSRRTNKPTPHHQPTKTNLGFSKRQVGLQEFGGKTYGK